MVKFKVSLQTTNRKSKSLRRKLKLMLRKLNKWEKQMLSRNYYKVKNLELKWKIEESKSKSYKNKASQKK